jgi:NitT/TauT family transport system ATP-binding protein
MLNDRGRNQANHAATAPAGSEEPVLLTLDRVGMAYGPPDRQFVAVHDVSIEIRSGEFVCLLGPSGCGKSTLLRIIAGLQRATTGGVLYRSRPVVGVNPHTTIVFQTFALFPWLTVLENVEVALKARGVPLAERQQRAIRLIDTVGLDGFESAYPRELSGGMRQKVGFARAMAVEPELLCLDEPFSALDVLSATALRGELMELWLNRSMPTRAVLMVTHNIEEAVSMADRIIVMEKDPGRVIGEIGIRLRHPRQRKDTAFQALVDRVYATVAGTTEPGGELLGTAPGQPGPTPKLPSARINGLAGLMDKLNEEGGRADLYRLADELHLELDDLLPIVEAAELLGFAHVQQGDITLTPLGQTFADASILARKEIVAGRILRQPTIRWIYETLQADDDRRVAEDYFLDKLRADFGDDAGAQLDTAINWARYAEVFAFDDDTDELYLES